MKVVKSLFLMLILILASSWLGFAFWPKYDPDRLNFWLLNVGQGESALVREPLGNWLLFDGGPDESLLSQIGQIMPPWEHTINLVVLSHPHADHLTGLIYLEPRYQILEYWEARSTFKSPEAESWKRIKPSNRLEVAFPHTMQLGQLYIQVLYPIKNNSQTNLSYPHDTDVVLSLGLPDPLILLTGDMETKQIQQLSKNCQVVNCQLHHPVLQVPHHGGKDSLNSDFLNLVNPALAIIPVGKDNPYHHPIPATLKLLETNQIPVLRTDLQAWPIQLHFNQKGLLSDLPP